jgi:glycosyltransferase involved in cell wall biosynthesis
MTKKTVLLSINASWNIINFRQGLIRSLQAAGYRVAAMAPPDAWSSRFSDIDVDYYPIEIDKQGVSPLRDTLLLGRYYRLLKAAAPDIYLGYTAKPNIYGSMAAQALGIPVINNVTGLGTAFIRKGPLTGIVSRLYQAAFRRSKTVFFQNEEDRALFSGLGLVQNHQARLLPGSGVDLHRFRPPSPERGPHAPFTFLLVARLLWDKGVGEYVEAARIVRAEGEEARFRLLGFLDVDNRTAIARADVDAWVRQGIMEYLGATDDVRPAIQNAGCVVLPSYREGLPRTLLEAAAMAKPLIATDVPGCRQVVEEGVNGFLCQARSGRSLAEAMLRMIRLTPAEQGSMGKAARAKVEREFDEEVVIRRYLAAINEALA